jgi:cytochrome c551/c552
MIRTRLAVFGMVVAAIAGVSSAAQAQGMSVDEALAKRGKTLWQNRGCAACHSIGKGRLAGPDLVDVTNRRSVAWLKRWLGNTTEMLATDSTAMALLAEAKGVKMPNLKLSDAESTALLHYIAQESAKKKGG